MEHLEGDRPRSAFRDHGGILKLRKKKPGRGSNLFIRTRQPIKRRGMKSSALCPGRGKTICSAPTLLFGNVRNPSREKKKNRRKREGSLTVSVRIDTLSKREKKAEDGRHRHEAVGGTVPRTQPNAQSYERSMPRRKVIERERLAWQSRNARSSSTRAAQEIKKVQKATDWARFFRGRPNSISISEAREKKAMEGGGKKRRCFAYYKLDSPFLIRLIRKGVNTISKKPKRKEKKKNRRKPE